MEELKCDYCETPIKVIHTVDDERFNLCRDCCDRLIAMEFVIHDDEVKHFDDLTVKDAVRFLRDELRKVKIQFE